MAGIARVLEATIPREPVAGLFSVLLFLRLAVRYDPSAVRAGGQPPVRDYPPRGCTPVRSTEACCPGGSPVAGERDRAVRTVLQGAAPVAGAGLRAAARPGVVRRARADTSRPGQPGHPLGRPPALLRRAGSGARGPAGP